MGSIAEKVARHAPSPVFILHEGRTLLTESGDAPHGSLRILVPLDGSEHAEAAIVPAALLTSALSAPARGELHLTQVVSSPGVEGSNFDQDILLNQNVHQLAPFFLRHSRETGIEKRGVCLCTGNRSRRHQFVTHVIMSQLYNILSRFMSQDR